jgi:hypothetical protein
MPKTRRDRSTVAVIRRRYVFASSVDVVVVDDVVNVVVDVVSPFVTVDAPDASDLLLLLLL